MSMDLNMLLATPLSGSSKLPIGAVEMNTRRGWVW